MDRIGLPDRVVDFRREEVRGRDGSRIELRPRAFGVLRRLAVAGGALVTKDELLTECWPGVIVTEDSLTQCISEIRKALGESGRDLIRTVPRRGYALVPPLEAPPPVPASALPHPRDGAPPPPPSPSLAAEPATAVAVQGDGTSLDAPERERAPVARAERRQLTVLSCELAAPAVLPSWLDPEELSELLAAFHHRAAEVIGRWAGHVAQEMGQGILAYFGYPQAHEDDAERAVQAGLELIEAAANGIALPTLLAGRNTLPALQLRAGVATSLVVVGGSAAERLGRGTAAVGEAPSRAARLQAMAEPGTVVVDAGTRRRLGGLFDCRDLGPLEAKGLPGAAVQTAWQVLGRTAASSRSGVLHGTAAATAASGTDLPSPPLLPSLVGRQEELGLLLRRWQQACEEDGQVVLLSGEPGIGKSRLTLALTERLSGEPHVTLRYFCSPYHQDSPLFPIIGQLERAAGFAREDTPEIKLGKLTALLAQATEQENEIALVAELMGLHAHGGGSRLLGLSPQRRRERLLQALLAQLVGLATRQPVLMLFEDAHWVDPTSLELLSLTVERIRQRGLPVLLVVTFRPEFHPPWAGLPHVASLSLGGLGRREAAALVARTAGADRAAATALPAAVVGQIVERTGGVPLFVEELTRAAAEADWHDASALAGGDEGAPNTAMTALLPDGAVPAMLYAPLAARLDRLGGFTREVAQVGAAIGREFGYELLAAVARRPEAELRSALDRLVEAGLVFRTGGDPVRAAYLYKHALVRDVAYGTLLRTRRRELHGAIAQVLAERFPEIAAAQPALLAQHYAQADQIGEAVEYLREAGRQAIAASAMAEARAHLTHGLALTREMPDSSARHLHQAELHLALGNVEMAIHGWGSPEYGAAFAEVVRLCRSLGPEHRDASRLLARALLGDYTHKVHVGQVTASHAIAEELFEFGHDHPDPEIRALSASSYGSSCLFFSRLQEGAQVFATAAADREISVHAEPMLGFGVDAACQFHIHHSRLLACQGLAEQAGEQLHASVDRARRLRHLPTLSAMLSASCDAVWILRDLHLLQQLSSELVRLAREQGFGFWLAKGSCYLGWSTAMDGDLEEGRALLLEGMAELTSLGVLFYGPLIQVMLADVHARTGQVDDARAALDKGLAISARTGEAWILAELHRLKGEVLCSRDPAAAEACVQQAIGIARDQSAKLFELRASVSLARLWREQGRRTEAHALLAPVYGWFSEGFDTPDLKEASTLLEMLR